MTKHTIHCPKCSSEHLAVATLVPRLVTVTDFVVEDDGTVYVEDWGRDDMFDEAEISDPDGGWYCRECDHQFEKPVVKEVTDG